MQQFASSVRKLLGNIDHFNYWVDNLPYYRNVRDEADGRKGAARERDGARSAESSCKA